MKYIKLVKAKSCALCVAWVDGRCRLGYKQEQISPPVVWNRPYGEWETWFVSTKPAEPCPKPKTKKLLIQVFDTFNMDWGNLMMRNG